MDQSTNLVKRRKVSAGNASENGENSLPGKRAPSTQKRRQRSVIGNVSHSISEISKMTVETTSGLPCCWSEAQKHDHCVRNTWLTVNQDGKLGCSICAKVATLTQRRTKGLMKLSKQWANNEISCYGATREKQQASLRKKIHEHKLTDSHKTAENILNEHSELMFDAVQSQLALSQCIETHCKLFRTVYYLAKMNRLSSNLEAEMELQSLNSSDVIKTKFRSPSSSFDIMRYIESEMKRKLVERIVGAKCKVAFLLDEISTNTSAVENVCKIAIYVRFFIDEMDEPVNVFLDIVEVFWTAEGGVLEIILFKLDELGFDEDYLREHMVSVAFDGVVTVFERNGVFATLLKQRFPQIIMWHCVAHCLELSVNDAVQQVNGTNPLKSFIEKLNYLRHISKWCSVELKDCASRLDQEIANIGSFIGVYRVASSHLAVEAIWQNYAALKALFERSEADLKRDTIERDLFGSLLKQLTSVSFVLNLGLLYDALRELAKLALELQSTHVNMSCAQKSILIQIRIFEGRADQLGEHERAAHEAVKEMRFFEIVLSDDKGVEQIDRIQLYRCLANELRKKLMNEDDGDLAHSINVLSPNNWPENVDDLYGEREIQTLCRRMQLEERSVIREFGKYKGNSKLAVPPLIKSLNKYIALIPISSKECVRSLSKMNAIGNALPTSFHIETVSSLLFINFFELPLSMFDPEPYVRSWIEAGKEMAIEQNGDDFEEIEHEKEGSHLWELIQ